MRKHLTQKMFQPTIKITVVITKYHTAIEKHLKADIIVSDGVSIGKNCDWIFGNV